GREREEDLDHCRFGRRPGPFLTVLRLRRYFSKRRATARRRTSTLLLKLRHASQSKRCRRSFRRCPKDRRWSIDCEMSREASLQLSLAIRGIIYATSPFPGIRAAPCARGTAAPSSGST